MTIKHLNDETNSKRDRRIKKKVKMEILNSRGPLTSLNDKTNSKNSKRRQK